MKKQFIFLIGLYSANLMACPTHYTYAKCHADKTSYYICCQTIKGIDYWVATKNPNAKQDKTCIIGEAKAWLSNTCRAHKTPIANVQETIFLNDYCDSYKVQSYKLPENLP